MKKKKKPSPNKSKAQYLARLLLSICSVVLIVGISIFVIDKTQKIPCANSISCVKNLSVDIENNTAGFFEGKKVIPPKIILAQDTHGPLVLGDSAAPGEKHIYVDLTHQTLTAYQGTTLVLKTLVATGKWHPTPTGTFRIWVKLRATRMSGGSGDDAYDLPNVPYTMFFSNDEVPGSAGFSLHGAYWHDNFGHPMSHGCVNMRIVDAKALYDWVSPTTNGTTTHATDDDPGTLVTITGEAPQ